MDTDQHDPIDREELRFIAEYSRELITRHDADGSYRYLSPACRRILGYDPAELVGVDPYSLMHPEDTGPLRDRHRAILEQAFIATATYRLRRKSGEWIWIETSGEAVRDQSGAIVELICVSRDVTERVLAEAAIREAEQLNRQIVRSAQEGIAVYDTDLHYLAWNPIMERLSGVTEADILGRTPLEVFPFLEEMGVYDLLLRAREGEVVTSPDYEYRPPGSSEPTWSAGKFGPLRSADGKITGVIATLWDISDRKRAEHELQESEERFRALVEGIPDALFVQDENLVYLDYHVKPTHRLWKQPHEFLGKSMLEVFPQAHLDMTVPLCRDVLATGIPAQIEYAREREDGVTFFEARMVRFGTNRLLTIVRDITGRKRAEEALRRSQESLAAAQAITHLGSWELELDDPTELANNEVWWSDETYRIFGYPPGSVRPSKATFLDAVHPEDRDAIIRGVMDSIRSRLPCSMDFRVARADGEERIVHNLSEVQGEEGRLKIVGTVQDVTEQRRAEAEIRLLTEELEARVRERTASLVAANKELEAYSYSVSHDLRTPLRAIDGYARLLDEDYGDLLPKEGHDYIERLRAGVRHMSSLIDDILTFSRIGRKALEIGEVDLRGLVDQALHLTEVDRQGREVETVIGRLPRGRGDASLLRQALVNVLSNAFKFTGPVGEPRVEIGCVEADEGLVLFVRDNGVGFDARHADKVFGVFQRLHRSDEFAGTGVGLAIVERIVEQHGGKVWAEGEEGKGATIWMRLPGMALDL